MVKKREDSITNIRNEKGDFTTNLIEIKRLMMKYYK